MSPKCWYQQWLSRQPEDYDYFNQLCGLQRSNSNKCSSKIGFGTIEQVKLSKNLHLQ